MLGLVNNKQVADAQLNFLFALVPISDDAATSDFVDNRCLPGQHRQREAALLIELQHQVEVRGGAGSLVQRRLDGSQQFLVVMLVTFVVANLK